MANFAIDELDDILDGLNDQVNEIENVRTRPHTPTPRPSFFFKPSSMEVGGMKVD